MLDTSFVLVVVHSAMCNSFDEQAFRSET